MEEPLLGPDIDCLGSVTKYDAENKTGIVWTQRCPGCTFEGNAIMPVVGAADKVLVEGDPVGVKFDTCGTNATLIIPILASPHGSDIQLARVKSFSSKNGYGFINILGSNVQDVHFTSRVCSSDSGLQKNRLCAIQLNEVDLQKPKATFVQPLLDAQEQEQLKAAPALAVSSSTQTLPILDLSEMTDLPADMATAHPAIVRQAQETAAAVLRTVLKTATAGAVPVIAQQPSSGSVNAQYVGIKSGRIKSWSPVNNYGFIVPDLGGLDVHINLASIAEMPNPQVGEPVYFFYDPGELPRRRGMRVRRAHQQPVRSFPQHVMQSTYQPYAAR
eukprot:TRINITY_DN20335_c0_g1_i1.p1 TRINITY_DN20335_c0_g1~~TRINITY_DN20335_c0_g1_i1.p1  ORF type:complete len:342 (+),score=45.69 TRINITY_DN20335_c0_g1_i1:39-1028(+)